MKQKHKSGKKRIVIILLSAGDALTAAGEFPSRFDLRDLGRVTPVKQQSH